MNRNFQPAYLGAGYHSKTKHLTQTFGILLSLFCGLLVYAQNCYGKTILVPAPSGNEKADRELIVTKLNEAQTSDTLLFSPGVYRISKKIQIDIHGIMLIGHSSGTIIRGCNPDDFTDHLHGILGCGGFELIGKGIIIENFIFEYAWHGLMIGCCLPNDKEQVESGTNIKTDHFGGHLIRNNTFRFNSTGIRVIGINQETVVIRDNIFLDNFHGLTINGSNVTVQGNSFRALNPEMIPIDREIDNAIGVLPFSTMFPHDNQPELNGDCENIEIIGNTIERIANDIRVSDSTQCKSLIIKGNTIKE